ncbi:unnamed protein product [Brachionus calyciflorus]|uniref:Uncharacterized protein n=1 Tax=Brachionus calyciflorus TaxID=104777 RepID=A0A814LYW5_9BILA|nr:unnamed protein product [Brachionus calyciflorus]
MSKSLLDQQADKLLNELIELIEEKWVLSTNIGKTCIQSFFQSYLKMSTEEGDQEVKESDFIENEINSDKLSSLSECNKNYERLKIELENMNTYKNRLEQINKNLNNLLKMDNGYFTEIDSDEFKLNLGQLVENYLKEFQLKKCLIEKYLFKARLKNECQITLASLWINEPFLDEFLLFKLKSFIKYHLLKIKK